MQLTPDQIAHYRRDGFLSLPPLIDAGEVEAISHIYDGLFSRRAGRELGEHFDLAGNDDEGAEPVLPQILWPSRHAPELLQTRLHAAAHAVARQLIGEDAVMTFDHAILKPARIGAPAAWHQDEAYWDGDQDYTSLSIWTPLQPVSRVNGCMEFIPGSHLEEVRTHHSIGHDPSVHGLEADEFDSGGAVPCPLEAGGATVHDARTLHYTGPNRSDAPRRAYIQVFSLPPRPRSSPRDFFWNRNKQTARTERAREAAEAGLVDRRVPGG